MSRTARTAVVAWVATAVYFFLQYFVRSAPAVMMPELSAAFGLGMGGVASMLGLFYYGYSPFSLIAGAAIDGLGPRKVVPVGAAAVGIGALLFASGNASAASVGRFLQGAGGAVAFVGAVYIASASFSPSKAGTLTGATQMFGMAGGSAGQFVVGPLIAGGLAWNTFWTTMGIVGVLMGALLVVVVPGRTSVGPSNWVRSGLRAMAVVFRNPQTYLCGFIAGLIFIPTTIFDMVWGVRYLQDAHGFEYGEAVMRSSTVPLGWIIGCPLLGYVSDRIGRRKPVIIGGALVLLVCLFWILYGVPSVFPPYLLGLVAGLASGAALVPTTVAKETNPPEVGGTATGAVNFLNFTFSALLGPVFGSVLMRAAGGVGTLELEHYQTAFRPMLFGVALAIVLALLLRETGPAVRRAAVSADASEASSQNEVPVGGRR